MNNLDIAVEKFVVLNRVSIGVCVLRKDFIVLHWNCCWENWTSISKQQILGAKLTKFFLHFSETQYISYLQEIFAGATNELITV